MYLDSAVLVGEFINDVSVISNADYILIDTSGHEEETHIYNLVYRSSVCNREGKEHNG